MFTFIILKYENRSPIRGDRNRQFILIFYTQSLLSIDSTSANTMPWNNSELLSSLYRYATCLDLVYIDMEVTNISPQMLSSNFFKRSSSSTGEVPHISATVSFGLDQLGRHSADFSGSERQDVQPFVASVRSAWFRHSVASPPVLSTCTFRCASIYP